MIARAGPCQDFEMGEVFSGFLDDLHAVVFVINRDDEDFGFPGSGGVEEFESGGVAVVALETEAADEVDVITVLLQDGGHAADHSEESDNGVPETAEAGEDDLGVIIFDIGFGFVGRFGGAEFGKDDFLEKDEKDG